MERVIGVIGLFVFIGLCWVFSANRKAIRWKPVIGGFIFQLIFAVLILKTPFGRHVFEFARGFFESLLSFSLEGARFVFGPLVKIDVASKAFGPTNAFIFAFQIAATIIFVASLMAVLYHLKIMQWVVYVFARVMQVLMGTSGSESLASAANVFMGQTEAPLVVRPYLEKMTHSELMALMTGGMATVAGGVLAAYVGFGIDAGHLLAASVMSAPASLAIAKLLVPETERSETAGTVPLQTKMDDANVIDAACRGAGEGIFLSLNVMGMILAFIALIALVNAGLNWVGELINRPLTLELLAGYLFAPFAFLMGVPKEDVVQVGTLLGTKTVLNEFIAYLQLAQLKATLHPRSMVIATYALCGFANFGSIAIQIGAIGTLVPKRRKDLARLGLLAMIGGTLASFMTASIAGVFL